MVSNYPAGFHGIEGDDDYNDEHCQACGGPFGDEAEAGYCSPECARQKRPEWDVP